jgi:predicted NUDIX family NTP pyrophosphohydrolase
LEKRKISAGILMYTLKNGLKVLLVHPGGPFFTRKDKGYWGIPKGLPEEEEDLTETARREFTEETGLPAEGTLIPLGMVIQKGGKNVYCYALEYHDDSPFELKCNTFRMEWPPASGKFQDFPEIDKGEFFSIDKASEYINPAQLEFLTSLQKHLNGE